MSTIELTDEILCAYIDAQLPPDARAQVEAALARDAGARVRLEKMQNADALLKQAFPDRLETHNDPLAERILADKPFVAQRRRSAMPYFASLAAGVGGLALGLFLQSQPATTNLMRDVDAGLQERIATALEHSGSGSTLQGVEGSVRVIMSFRAQDGRWCRAFDVASTPSSAEAIACRNAKGNEADWRIVAWDATHAASSGFKPAGSGEFLDAAMERLGSTAALEVDQESQLIKKQWHDQ